MATIRNETSRARSRLAEHSERPDLDSLHLLAHTMHRDTSWVLCHPDHRLTPAQHRSYAQAINKRRAGWPLAYLTGQKEFFGRSFFVSAAVLIPRPATEEIVERILRDHGQGHLIAADIGTGSGAIAITLTLARPRWDIIGIEPSPSALAIARKNQRRYHARIQWKRGSFTVPLGSRPVDLLVANLPYLNRRELAHPTIRQEPTLALDGGGPDGLTCYRRFMAAIVTPPRQALYLECLTRQIRPLRSVVRHRWPTSAIEVIRNTTKTPIGLVVRWPR